MSPSSWRIEVGDCRDVLRSMPAGSVHTAVTSPPYFGLRDYGTGEWEGGDPACDHLGAPHRTQAGFNERYFGCEKVEGWKNKQAELREPYKDGCGKCGARRVDRQIGLEPTPDEFVAALVAVFREVRRVLRDDGTVWLNLGDSYTAGHSDWSRWKGGQTFKEERRPALNTGVKPKDLLGIPWMVAFALRADGWYLRSDIIWSKPNPMPESVTDRPTKAHEYVFLLSKGPRYFYDADAIRELLAENTLRPSSMTRAVVPASQDPTMRTSKGANGSKQMTADESRGANKRSVWTVATQPYAGAHFATFPPKLIEPMILAGAPERACGECGAPWVRVVEREQGRRNTSAGSNGQQVHRPDVSHDLYALPARTVGFEPSCSHGDGSAHSVVLDPFAGAGTTGIVALQHRRNFIGIELNPEYAAMARTRIETAVRLGFRSPQNGPVQIPGQASIFDLDGAA